MANTKLYKYDEYIKRANENLNHAYDIAREEIHKSLLETPHDERDDEWTDLYWFAPHYPHQWRDKHSEVFTPKFAGSVALIEQVARMKSKMKDIYNGK